MALPHNYGQEYMRLIADQLREEVHHRDGNALNNDLSNLLIIVRVKREFTAQELERGRTVPALKSGSYVAPSLTSEQRAQSNGSET